MTMPNLDTVGHRWVAAMAGYNFEIEYIWGLDNKVTDTLSRVGKHLDEDAVKELLDQGIIKELLNNAVRYGIPHAEADRSLLLLSTRFLGRDQHLRMSRTLHRPAPDPLLRPIDGRYGQEGWYPRRDPTTRLAALDAEQIPDRKSTSCCVMTTLHLGRDDRGKENAVSPP